MYLIYQSSSVMFAFSTQVIVNPFLCSYKAMKCQTQAIRWAENRNVHNKVMISIKAAKLTLKLKNSTRC